MLCVSIITTALLLVTLVMIFLKLLVNIVSLNSLPSVLVEREGRSACEVAVQHCPAVTWRHRQPLSNLSKR